MNILLMLSADGHALQQTAEAEAFEALYALYYQPIARYLTQLCGSPEQAEELAQETFVRAYTGLLTFRHEATVATWLFRIARNLYLNSQRRQQAAPIDAAQWQAIPDQSGYGDPDLHIAATEQRAAIRVALEQLPEPHRSILLLRDGAGLSYVEVADVIGISVAAVRMKLFRARNIFRRAYSELEGDHDDGEL